jgi:hypothetical protein
MVKTTAHNGSIPGLLPQMKEGHPVTIGPAERIDAIVEMDQPGNWILGANDDHDREHGMGTVIEYSGQSGDGAGSL